MRLATKTFTFNMPDQSTDAILSMTLAELDLYRLFLSLVLGMLALCCLAYQAYCYWTDKHKRQENTQHYIAYLEKKTIEQQQFIHDYQNLVSSLKLGLIQEDLSTIRNAFKEVLAEPLSLETTHSLNFSAIQSASFQSLLATCWGRAHQADVTLQTELLGAPPFTMPATYNRSIYRIIGILLDNAIQAAAHCQTGLVSVGLTNAREGQPCQIVICNTFNQAETVSPDLNPRQPKPCSDHGWGLRFVHQYLKKHINQYTLKTEVREDRVYQVLTFQEGL
ncbi:GHKL domain-containing protein [Leuconostocaceae bacterium ESL0723]|nr:GHKL domain-containing protein [Leuconostocaceae bacterium ESL0723]